MFRTLLFFIVAFQFLFGCQSDTSEEASFRDEVTSIESYSISGMDKRATVGSPRVIDLNVSGMRNNVDVTSNVRRLVVSGVENQITIRDGVSVNEIEISGIDNSLNLPANLVSEISESGIRIEVSYRAP